MTKLLTVNLALLALNVAHALDHAFNQGQGLKAIGLVGGLGVAASLLAVILCLRGARIAALLTTVVGFTEAIGFSLIHLAPKWSAISDPYYEAAGVNGFSWVVLVLSVALAVYAGVVGLKAWRSARDLSVA
jgi:hypothetical protein